MTPHQRKNLKDRLLKLINLKCTGTPADLAMKFDISARSIKRMISELREEGYDIKFWYPGRTYVLVKDYQ
jgi:biotin operon repressor